MIALAAENVFDGHTMHARRVVTIDGAHITGVGDRAPPGVAVATLPDGAVLAPGFVDLQVNGGGGVLFNDTPTAAGLRRIASAHARLGTTALLATLISAPVGLRRRGMDAVRAAVADGIAGICGVHVEGPFIAPARRGIHPRENLAVPAPAELAELRAPFPAPLLLTVAPEIVPPDAIAALAGDGVTVFLGHSDATFDQAAAALRAGATGLTHLFNAMSQFAPRAPGMVGAALDAATAAAGIIVDGLHVHPAAIRVAFRALGPGRLLLISDAMPTVGDTSGGDTSGRGGFDFDGRRIRLDGGRLTDDAGTLAGAHLSMADAVRNAVRLAGLPLDAVLRMATATPAERIGLAGHGRIAPGARADLVVLDGDLRVIAVWQGGQRIGAEAQAFTN